jgi:Stress responsive A/B Barrel Domain
MKRLAIALLLIAASCQTAKSPTSVQMTAGDVQHVVICWLKIPGDETARKSLIDATRSFADIRGVTSVRVGRVLPSTRPVVDSSYDVGIVMTFKDTAAMADYESDPKHLAAVRDVLKPFVARYVIYDFIDGK